MNAGVTHLTSLWHICVHGRDVLHGPRRCVTGWRYGHLTSWPYGLVSDQYECLGLITISALVCFIGDNTSSHQSANIGDATESG